MDRVHVYDLGAALLRATEEAAPAHGRTLIVLDISVIEMPRAYITGFSSTENFIAEVRMFQRWRCGSSRTCMRHVHTKSEAVAKAMRLGLV